MKLTKYEPKKYINTQFFKHKNSFEIILKI